jgi:hypothetical protein
MKTVWLAALSLAGATLAAGPVTYLRTQRHVTKPQPSLPTAPVAINAAAAPAIDEPPLPKENSVQVTGELVKAAEIRSAAKPVPTRTAAETAGRRRSAPPPRRSLLARVFFGSSGYRPSPFPRPGS